MAGTCENPGETRSDPYRSERPGGPNSDRPTWLKLLNGCKACQLGSKKSMLMIITHSEPTCHQMDLPPQPQKAWLRPCAAR